MYFLMLADVSNVELLISKSKKFSKQMNTQDVVCVINEKVLGPLQNPNNL